MAAVNGGRRSRADHPRLPLTPREIAEECARSAEAGAAAAHVHARDGEGRHVLDAGLFREILAEIDSLCGRELVAQVTTETQDRFAPADIMAMVRTLARGRLEAVSIALRDLMPGPAEEAEAAPFLAWLHESRIWPQFILYDTGELSRFLRLCEAGLFPWRRPFLLFVVGGYRGRDPRAPDRPDPFVAGLAPETMPWAVCAFGGREHDAVRRAIALGGHVRVGFENNLHLPDGGLAASNADLVALAVERAHAEGRPILTAPALRRAMAARRAP